jgi:hypothetical protein
LSRAHSQLLRAARNPLRRGQIPFLAQCRSRPNRFPSFLERRPGAARKIQLWLERQWGMCQIVASTLSGSPNQTDKSAPRTQPGSGRNVFSRTNRVRFQGHIALHSIHSATKAAARPRRNQIDLPRRSRFIGSDRRLFNWLSKKSQLASALLLVGWRAG